MTATTYYMTIDGGYIDYADDMKLVARQNGASVGSDDTIAISDVAGSKVATGTIDYGIEVTGVVDLTLLIEATRPITLWTGTDSISSGSGEGSDSDAVTLAAIKAKTDLLGTFGATVPVRYAGTGILLYIGELQTVTINTVTDLSAKTLVVEFDDRRGTQVTSIADGSITKTSTTIAFSATSTLTASPRALSYAVRDTTSKEVYVYGFCVIDNLPVQ